MQGTGQVITTTPPPPSPTDKSPREIKKRKREEASETKEEKKQKLEDTRIKKSDCRELECSPCTRFRIGTVFVVKQANKPVVNFGDATLIYSEKQWNSARQLRYKRKCQDDPVYATTIRQIKQQSPHLSRLDFETCTFQESACNHLFTTMPTLEQLVFNKVSLPWIEKFPKNSNFPELRILRFWNCENLSDNLFTCLCKDLQPVLTKLDLVNTPLNEDSLLDGLECLTNLLKLAITHNSHVRGSFFKALRSMNHLRALKLVDLPNLQSDVFYMISRLPKLISVEMTGSQSLDVALKDIVRIPKLRRIALHSFDSISADTWEKCKIILKSAEIERLVIDTRKKGVIKNLKKHLPNTKICRLSRNFKVK